MPFFNLGQTSFFHVASDITTRRDPRIILPTNAGHNIFFDTYCTPIKACVSYFLSIPALPWISAGLMEFRSACANDHDILNRIDLHFLATRDFPKQLAAPVTHNNTENLVSVFCCPHQVLFTIPNRVVSFLIIFHLTSIT
jgi:hypothetical protein